MASGAQSISGQLRALSKEFERKVPAKAAEILAAVVAVRDAPFDLTGWRRAYGIAHSLAGAAGTFGLPDVGTTARAIEEIAAPLAAGVHPPRVEDAARLLEAAETLRRLAAADPMQSDRFLAARPVASHPSRAGSTVYVLDADREVASALQLHIQQFGYTVKTFASAARLLEALDDTVPCATLVEAALLDSDPASEAFLQEAARRGIAVLFMSANSGLAARLRAFRAGGSGYLLKPIVPSILLDHLEAVLEERAHEAHRVLIVDDDVDLAQAYAAILRETGCVCRVLSEPMAALDAIAQFHPDLVLMDLHMPGVTGMELAGALRQDERLIGLPIVFLSCDSELERHLDALAAGADDFMVKPIAPETLVRSVRARIERARRLSALTDRDGLTGLLNRSRLEEGLRRETSRALRERTPLSLCLVDIDHFKKVNDEHGHLVGDRVLRAFALLLKRRLRQVDVPGRWGGEEFAIVLPSTRAADAARVMDDLRTRFAAVLHAGADRDFQVTFSVGIAELQSEDRTPQLARADRALYAAKERGRNQVVVAEAGSSRDNGPGERQQEPKR